jgi:hypothetical protein
MNPIELVKRDLTPEEWDAACQSWREPIQEMAEQCPFSRHRLFIVHGRTRQFDFPTLPHGSYGYYAANGRSAVRLTRKNREIQTILADEWTDLPRFNPVRLASLVLKFFDAGIKASHQVLQDADALLVFGNPTPSAKNYELNQKEFAKALPQIGSTKSTFDGKCLSVRAVTLCGWMHDRQNLGIESFTIGPDGNVSFAKRQVLSQRIFARVPAIRY